MHLSLGDSGGILMKFDAFRHLEDRRAVQKAVVYGSTEKCNGKKYPSIFNRLDNKKILPWILENVFSTNNPQKGTYILYSNAWNKQRGHNIQRAKFQRMPSAKVWDSLMMGSLP